MTRKVEVRLHTDGSLWLWVDGREMQPSHKVTLTAAEIAILARDHLWAGVEIGGVAARKQHARQQGASTSRLVQSAAVAGVKAGAKAVAPKVFEAGARYVLQNSRLRRTVERDADGTITGTVESREPIPMEGKS
jgi:hypothetical protein